MTYHNYGLLVGGQWRAADGGAELAVYDPFDEVEIGRIPQASERDMDDALAAARSAQAAVKAMSGWERSERLRAIAHFMADRTEEACILMSRETGKPLAEAKGEWRAACEQFDWYADEARRIFGHSLDGREPNVRLSVRYDPVGPVAAFTAWNFPALLPARKIAAALAAGCSVVIKPSEEAPSSCFIIAACAVEAGWPAGALNVLTGDPAEISSRLIGSPVIRKVSLTGSIPVGKQILRQCADTVKKVSMELGGHAPVIIFPDSDPVAAGQACARVKFRNAGQVCISPSRFYVHEEIYEPFSRAMAETASMIRLGRGLDEGTECGPMANGRGRDRALRLIDDAVDRGAELLAGGSVPADRNCGFFLSPTVLGRVSDDAAIMQEEPFAPVAPISTFMGFDEVIERANGVPFGLAGYVFSGSLETAHRAAEALEVGMVGVNDLLLAAAEVPFGGVKESGVGREGGRLGILDYLEPKYVKLRFN